MPTIQSEITKYEKKQETKANNEEEKQLIETDDKPCKYKIQKERKKTVEKISRTSVLFKGPNTCVIGILKREKRREQKNT